MRVWLFLLGVLVAAPCRADELPLTGRWRGTLPDDWTCLDDGWDVALCRPADSFRFAFEIGETGRSGPLDARAITSLVRAAPSAACTTRDDGPRTWVRCEPAFADYAPEQVILTHTDGFHALVQLRGDASEWSALVRSLRPQAPEHPCDEDCPVGPPHWLTLHAEHGHRLARRALTDRMDARVSVVEADAGRAPALEIQFIQIHHPTHDDPGRFLRKITLLGEPVPVFESNDGHRTIGLGGEFRGPILIDIAAENPEAHERALRLLEYADPGPALSRWGGPLPSSLARPPKPPTPHESATLSWGPLLSIGLGLVLAALGIVMLMRRRA